MERLIASPQESRDARMTHVFRLSAVGVGGHPGYMPGFRLWMEMDL